MEKAIDLKLYKKAAITFILISLSVALPQIFHLCGLNGPAFLPMHIPVLLAGFLLGPTYGFIAGMISPVVSTALTGMPVEFPVMLIMVLELATYGFVSGILTKYTKLPTMISLFITMMAGRISYLIAYELIKAFMLPTINANISMISATTKGLPGIVFQLVFITIFIYQLKKKEKKNNEA